MSNIKKGFVVRLLAVAFSLALVSSTSVFASSPTSKGNVPNILDDCIDIKGEVSYQKDENGEPIKKVVKISNVQEYAKQRGLQLPSANAEIIHISPIIDTNNVPNSQKSNSEVSPQEIGGKEYYIKNVQAPREACGDSVLRISYYSPPGGRMAIQEAVSATFGGTVTVGSQIVSAAVNFSVTSSFQVTDTQEVIVPAGKRARVTAYPIYHVTQYDIWERDLFFDDYIGHGYAKKPVGACFDIILY